MFNGIKQKVESAKKAVEQWVDAKLKRIRDMAAKAQQYVSDKIDAARKAVSEKVAQLRPMGLGQMDFAESGGHAGSRECR